MRAACDWSLAPRPLWLLLALSVAIAALGCATLFDAGFIAGTSAYWDAPGGIEGGSLFDIPGVLSADQYFIREPWGLPLFHIAGLGVPGGSNGILVGSVPIVAIVGRLVFQMCGQIVNLYGLWTVLAYIGAGAAMSLLVALLGARGVAACVMATITGAFMPELLARWGHIPLLPQGQIISAFALYLLGLRHGRLRLGLVGLLLVTLLALWSQAYLFVMVAAMALATLVQAAIDRRISLRSAVFCLAGAVAMIAAIIAISGHLSGGAPLSGEGLGYYSLALLSMVTPQMSGLLPPYADTMLDMTGGQYEGFSYLGGGLLLLLPFTLPQIAVSLWRRRRRDGVLFVAVAACFLFALSNVIVLTPQFGIVIPLPDLATKLASVFRSTGRFVWPAMFAIAAATIASVPRLFGRAAAPILLLAAGLQWLDTAPLRHALAAATAAPMPMPLDTQELRADIPGHDVVHMLPSFACTRILRPMPDGLPEGLVSVQVELEAARAGVPTNSFYAARQDADCAAERAMGATPLGPRELRIYLRGTAAAVDERCRAMADAVICDGRKR